MTKKDVGMAIVAFVLAVIGSSACSAGFMNNRSKSTYEVDDGVHPVRRVSVTTSGHANGLASGMAVAANMSGVGVIGYGGYGPAGYGAPVVGGGNLCMVHPDYCGTVVTVMTPAAPQYVQGGTAQQATDSELEGRVSDLEKKSEVNRQVLIRDHQNRKIIVGYLGSALVLNRASCEHITANPDSLVIDGEPELTKQVRAEVLTKCTEILSAQKGKN